MNLDAYRLDHGLALSGRKLRWNLPLILLSDSVSRLTVKCTGDGRAQANKQTVTMKILASTGTRVHT